jgi:hypothetical protein
MKVMSPLISQEEVLQSDDGDERITVYVPLLERYHRIMTMLWGDDKDKKSVTKHREALFGPDMPPMSIPDLYQELGMIRDLGIDLTTYRQMYIHDRAQIIAEYRLANMMQVFKRHIEIIAENNKKALEKANKKK